VAFSRGHGAAVAFAMLPNRRDAGEPESGQPVPEEYLPYRKVMREIATKAGAPLADIPPAIAQAKGAGRGPLFLDVVHPTAEGNAVMAEVLERTLWSDASIRRALGAR
jgi:lysophospholipase L1-like esterase